MPPGSGRGGRATTSSSDEAYVSNVDARVAEAAIARLEEEQRRNRAEIERLVAQLGPEAEALVAAEEGGGEGGGQRGPSTRQLARFLRKVEADAERVKRKEQQQRDAGGPREDPTLPRVVGGRWGPSRGPARGASRSRGAASSRSLLGAASLRALAKKDPAEMARGVLQALDALDAEAELAAAEVRRRLEDEDAKAGPGEKAVFEDTEALDALFDSLDQEGDDFEAPEGTPPEGAVDETNLEALLAALDAESEEVEEMVRAIIARAEGRGGRRWRRPPPAPFTGLGHDDAGLRAIRPRAVGGAIGPPPKRRAKEVRREEEEEVHLSANGLPTQRESARGPGPGDVGRDPVLAGQRRVVGAGFGRGPGRGKSGPFDVAEEAVDDVTVQKRLAQQEAAERAALAPIVRPRADRGIMSFGKGPARFISKEPEPKLVETKVEVPRLDLRAAEEAVKKKSPAYSFGTDEVRSRRGKVEEGVGPGGYSPNFAAVLPRAVGAALSSAPRFPVERPRETVQEAAVAPEASAASSAALSAISAVSSASSAGGFIPRASRAPLSAAERDQREWNRRQRRFRAKDDSMLSLRRRSPSPLIMQPGSKGASDLKHKVRGALMAQRQKASRLGPGAYSPDYFAFKPAVKGGAFKPLEAIQEARHRRRLHKRNPSTPGPGAYAVEAVDGKGIASLVQQKVAGRFAPVDYDAFNRSTQLTDLLDGTPAGEARFLAALARKREARFKFGRPSELTGDAARSYDATQGRRRTRAPLIVKPDANRPKPRESSPERSHQRVVHLSYAIVEPRAPGATIMPEHKGREKVESGVVETTYDVVKALEFTAPRLTGALILPPHSSMSRIEKRPGRAAKLGPGAGSDATADSFGTKAKGVLDFGLAPGRTKAFGDFLKSRPSYGRSDVWWQTGGEGAQRARGHTTFSGGNRVQAAKLGPTGGPDAFLEAERQAEVWARKRLKAKLREGDALRLEVEDAWKALVGLGQASAGWTSRFRRPEGRRGWKAHVLFEGYTSEAMLFDRFGPAAKIDARTPLLGLDLAADAVRSRRGVGVVAHFGRGDLQSLARSSLPKKGEEKEGEIDPPAAEPPLVSTLSARGVVFGRAKRFEDRKTDSAESDSGDGPETGKIPLSDVIRADAVLMPRPVGQTGVLRMAVTTGRNDGGARKAAYYGESKLVLEVERAYRRAVEKRIVGSVVMKRMSGRVSVDADARGGPGAYAVRTERWAKALAGHGRAPGHTLVAYPKEGHTAKRFHEGPSEDRRPAVDADAAWKAWRAQGQASRGTVDMRLMLPRRRESSPLKTSEALDLAISPAALEMIARRATDGWHLGGAIPMDLQLPRWGLSKMQESAGGMRAKVEEALGLAPGSMSKKPEALDYYADIGSDSARPGYAELRGQSAIEPNRKRGAWVDYSRERSLAPIPEEDARETLGADDSAIRPRTDAGTLSFAEDKQTGPGMTPLERFHAREEYRTLDGGVYEVDDSSNWSRGGPEFGRQTGHGESLQEKLQKKEVHRTLDAGSYEGAESWAKAVARKEPSVSFGDSETERFPAEHRSDEGDVLLLRPSSVSDPSVKVFTFPKAKREDSTEKDEGGEGSTGREELARGLDLVRQRGTAKHAADLRFGASEAERFPGDNPWSIDNAVTGLGRRDGDVLVLADHGKVERDKTKRREAVLAHARERVLAKKLAREQAAAKAAAAKSK